MTLSRIQSRVVTSLLTGHNTPRRHLYLLGLSKSPLCRWCEAGEETSSHVVCECEALTPRRHAYLASFFLEPGDIKNLSLGAIWNYSKAEGSHDSIWGTKGLCQLRPRCIGAESSRTHMRSIYLFIYVRTYVPTYLPTYLPTYIHIYLPIYQPECENLEIAEFRTPTRQDIRKKGSKILKLPMLAIVIQ